MEFREFKEFVKKIPVGKQLPDAVYIHESALDVIPEELVTHLAQAISELKLGDKDWNVLKFFKRDHKITLLDYPDFLEDSYPALHTSYTVNLEDRTVRESSYKKSENPPILHRKETFIKPNHPSFEVFKSLTKEGEDAGLYENTKTIGFKQSWAKVIKRKGYVLEDGHIKLKIDETVEQTPVTGEVNVERHRTAIDRDRLSVPMQLLARHHYFDGSFSIFDYGCGKGDDVRELEAHGLDIHSWDPVHRADNDKKKADIVNIGYVINVIEKRSERDSTLKDAYQHANKVLAVSAMIAGESVTSQFKPYKDGIITSRNTFQKYFNQAELRSYIESTLEENAIAVNPGVFFVFKDKDEEQLFLSERQKNKRTWQHLTQRERRETAPQVTKDKIEKHAELFNDFWKTCLELGRIPANPEFEFSERIRSVAGSHKKAFEALIDSYGNEDFEQSQKERTRDLLVYFALGLFDRRKAYAHMPESLKRDLKVFFNTYPEALETAKELLFSVGSPENIRLACENTYKRLNTGYLDGTHSYTLHSSLINQLPPTLRVYIGCAVQLYGDIEGIDLVKIHMTSGKVTLLRYDDWSKDTPMLLERIKIKMRDQDIDFFDYSGEYEPQPLVNKMLYSSSG